PAAGAAHSREPNLLIRGVWFFFIGSWESFWVATLAWLLAVTVIGLPLACWFLNRIPQVATIKAAQPRLQAAGDGETGTETATVRPGQERPGLQRATWC